MMRPSALFLCFLLLLPAVTLAQQPEERPQFGRDRLVIETLEGERFGFLVELALTPRQQAYGLMFQRGLRPDEGMLFLMEPPRRASFWMKNTFIPLDMLFIAEDGEVLQIAERVPPRTLESVVSDEEVRAVLEINGGMSEQLGITPGARVLYKAFE
jgi:uncharacterized membrane protein (UPF0127 family)